MQLQIIMWVCKHPTLRHAYRLYVCIREKREDEVLSKERIF